MQTILRLDLAGQPRGWITLHEAITAYARGDVVWGIGNALPVYGGTHHLMHQVLQPFGIRCVGVPAGDAGALKRAIASTPGLRVVFVETPANPTLRMTDIAAAAAAARALPERPLLAVDNTFLGPAFQTGNIRETSFGEIWRAGQAMRRMRQPSAFRGGCRARSLAFAGSVDAPDPWMEEFLRGGSAWAPGANIETAGRRSTSLPLVTGR